MEYLWKPPACYNCKAFGHSIDNCGRRVIKTWKTIARKQPSTFVESTKQQNASLGGSIPVCELPGATSPRTSNAGRPTLSVDNLATVDVGSGVVQPSEPV